MVVAGGVLTQLRRRKKLTDGGRTRNDHGRWAGIQCGSCLHLAKSTDYVTQHNRVAVGRGIRRSFIHCSRLLPRRLLDFLGRRSQQSSFLTHSEEESEKGEKRKRGIFFLMLWTASVSVYVCVGSLGIARIKIKAHIQSMCCCCCWLQTPFSHTLPQFQSLL